MFSRPLSRPLSGHTRPLILGSWAVLHHPLHRPLQERGPQDGVVRRSSSRGGGAWYSLIGTNEHRD